MGRPANTFEQNLARYEKLCAERDKLEQELNAARDWFKRRTADKRAQLAATRAMIAPLQKLVNAYHAREAAREASRDLPPAPTWGNDDE